jgi:hypothetical protein
MALTHAGAATRDDSALPRLAVMLCTALRAGMSPSEIRSILPARFVRGFRGRTYSGDDVAGRLVRPPDVEPAGCSL